MVRQRIILMCFSLAGILSLFLPWTSFQILGVGYRVNGLHGPGWLVGLIFVGMAFLTFHKYRQEALSQRSWFLLICLAAINSLLMAWLYFRALESVVDTLQLDRGFFLALASAVGSLFFAWIYRSPTHTLGKGWKTIMSKYD